MWHHQLVQNTAPYHASRLKCLWNRLNEPIWRHNEQEQVQTTLMESVNRHFLEYGADRRFSLFPHLVVSDFNDTCSGVLDHICSRNQLHGQSGCLSSRIVCCHYNHLESLNKTFWRSSSLVFLLCIAFYSMCLPYRQFCHSTLSPALGVFPLLSDGVVPFPAICCLDWQIFSRLWPSENMFRLVCKTVY